MSQAKMSVLLCVGMLLVFGGQGAFSQEPKKMPAAAARAKLAVVGALKKKDGPKAQVEWLNEKSLKTAFPKHHFFSVRYRQYPVAVQPPKGLRSSNVYVVMPSGKPKVLNTKEGLQKFVKANYPGAKGKVTSKSAVALARSVLTLNHALIQDGFYKFEIRNERKLGEASGRIFAVRMSSLVAQGGKGNVVVEVSFSKKGTVAKIESKAKIMAGPRPRCQATKLLDPDPIVRYMATTELKFMGLAAKPYLLEQRAKADPKLRKAIDRLIREIEAAGW